MSKLITFLFLLISVNLMAQDIITMPDGKVYDVKIVEDKGDLIKFYLLNDSLKSIKIVARDQISMYEKANTVTTGTEYTQVNHLKKARNQLYTGLICQAVGVFTLAFGDDILSANSSGFKKFSKYGKSFERLKRTGVGVVFIGSIFIAAGVTNFYKANMKLYESESTALNIKLNPSGLSLVYSF